MRSPAASGAWPFAADPRGHLARRLDQGLLVAAMVLQPLFARRQQAQSGDAVLLLVIDRGGEAMCEAAAGAVAGEEPLGPCLGHLLEERALGQPLAVRQLEVLRRDQ